MAQLEPLNLKLTGSAEGLTAALGRAQGDVHRFGSSVGGISSQFSGLSSIAGKATLAIGAGLAGLAAAAGLAAGAISRIREAMKGVDDTDDAAKRLGVTFNELRGLRFAFGRITGADSSQVDSAITKMQINLGEAARTGTGEVNDALKSLGFSAAQLIDAGPGKAMQMLAERIGEVGDKSKQLQLVYDIFGKSGLPIAGAFREGGKELQSLIEKQAKIATLTQDQVALIGWANDAWEDVGKAVTGVFEQISAGLAPLMQIVAEDLFGAVTGGLKEAGDYAKLFADTIGQVWGFFNDLTEVVRGLADAMAKFIGGEYEQAGQSLKRALTFDQMEKNQQRMDAIRESAKTDARPKRRVTDAEAETLDAKGQIANAESASLASQLDAAKSSRSAVDSLKLKADQVKQQIEMIKPQALSAVTDLQAQIKKIAELRGAGERNDAMLNQQKTTNTKLDKLIAAVEATGTEPQPIDLD